MTVWWLRVRVAWMVELMVVLPVGPLVSGCSVGVADRQADPGAELCDNTCGYPADGECDDGGSGALTSVCEYGTDCTDCGPRSGPLDDNQPDGDVVVDDPDPGQAAPPAALCTNTCDWAGDGECDDGGAGALTALCALGSDCEDCGPRGDAADHIPADDPDDPREPGDIIVLNGDPGDDVIMSITREVDGDTTVIRGQKDEDGAAIKVDSYEIWTADTDLDGPGWLIEFGDDAWPAALTGPAGERATFTYEGDEVAVEYWDAAGTFYDGTLQLEPGARTGSRLASAPGDVPSDNEARIFPPLDPGSLPRVDVSIRGRLLIFAKTQDFGGPRFQGQSEGEVPVTGASVGVSITNNFGPADPHVVEPAIGVYRFTCVHSTPDVSKRIEECQSRVTKAALAIGGTGVGLSTLGLAAAFGAISLGPWGVLVAIFAVSFDVSGVAATVQGARCDTVMRRRAVAEGVGNETVRITVAHRDLPETYALDRVTYNLWDSENDPVARSRSFDRILFVPSCTHDRAKLSAAQVALQAARDAGGPQTNREECEVLWYTLRLSNNDCLTPEGLRELGYDDTLLLGTDWHTLCGDGEKDTPTEDPPPPDDAPCSVVGSWRILYDNDCDGVQDGEDIRTLHSDGTITDHWLPHVDLGQTWEVQGSTFTLTDPADYEGGSTMIKTAKVSADCWEMTFGTTTFTNLDWEPAPGCWAAKRRY